MVLSNCINVIDHQSSLPIKQKYSIHTLNILMDIITSGNRAIGIGEYILGQQLSLSCKIVENHKNWITRDIMIDINSNDEITFLEYYASPDSPKIKYKDYVLLEHNLKDDIQYLLGFSYCFYNYGTYYFPMIGLALWTNEDEDKPAFCIKIYQYGYYDSIKEYANFINNQCECTAGELIKMY